MKIFSLTTLFLLCSINLSFGQVNALMFYADYAEVKNYYQLDRAQLSGNQYKILLHVKFGEAEIINIHELVKLDLGTVKSIKLYYSDYPRNRSFHQLNKKRFDNLLSATNIQSNEGIEWGIIRQTACNNEKQARKLFHGFEVILEYPDDLNLTTIAIDTSFKDFVVEKVLKRNDWREMLIVSDMTGSMSPYISQLFLWLKLNALDDRIKQFVFFNDGDSSLDENKKIGKTGGLYQTKSKDYEEVVRIATQCIISGTGGDIPENDIEALLKGIKLCPDCLEYILIADNMSTIRDLKLLKKINRPIRVIICGGIEEINPEYLNLARVTGGSIHLIEEDLFNLMKINEGEIIDINGTEYIVEKNRFTKYQSM